MVKIQNEKLLRQEGRDGGQEGRDAPTMDRSELPVVTSPSSPVVSIPF